MGVKKIEYESVDWIYPAKDTNKRCTIGKAVMNFRIA